MNENNKPRRRTKSPPEGPQIDHLIQAWSSPAQRKLEERRRPKMAASIYKRKKRKCASIQAICIVVGWLALAELVCDTRNGPVRLASASSTAELREDKERFVDGQPMDTVALLGQPADLSCLVESKRGELAWIRDDFGLGVETVDAPYADRYSLRTSSAPEPTSQSSISNYTLHIGNVSLADDAQFLCALNYLTSRSARLTVWRPPSRLLVGASVWAAERVADDEDSNDLTTLLELNPSGQPDGAAPTSETPSIQRITVKQGSRLRLECRSDASKPHAELVWWDGQDRRVPERPFQGGSTSNESLAEAEEHSLARKLVEADQNEPKLAYTSLIWSFRVNQRHANQVLTCQAQHPAFEQKQLPELLHKQLRRQVQLDVHYPPERIEITKEPSQALENKPIRFLCSAQARPNQLTFRWFIDNQLVANASEPELRIERLTRQMHLRELRCEVTNPVGTESAAHRLAVHYAPAFVTHLLPASLQPPLPSPEIIVGGHSRALQSHQPGRTQQRYLRLPTSAELALGHQLAIGFERGDDIQLRCDFDSNPRLKQVLWFKMNTDYDIMTNVTPRDADELIEMGASRAIFRPSVPLADSDENYAHERWHGKRHIAQPEVAHPDEHWSQPELDYAQMSEQLLDELALYDSSGPERNQPSVQQVVEPISSSAPSSTSAKISEPLGWTVSRWSSQQARQLVAVSSPNPHATSESASTGTGARRLVSLGLVQPGAANASTRAQLFKREVSLSSSFLLIKAAREESTGRYVCKSKPAEGFPAMARAVYLVQRKEPRLISLREQWAPAGERRLQVECLAEVRAVIDNMTSVSWTKNGQPIHELLSNNNNSNSNHNEQQTSKWLGTNISIRLERSPDFLYVRSVLHIESDELDNYFGQYNCTITNSRGSDHLIVDLQKMKPTGFVFAAMASLAVSAVLLLVCILGLLIVCAPRSKLQTKSQIMSHPGQQLKQSAARQDAPDGSVSSASDRKSPRSLDSQEVMLDGRVSSRLVQQGEPQEGSTSATIQTAYHNHHHQLQHIERAGSAFEPARSGDHSLPQYGGHKMRASLRHPAQLSTQQAHRSGRFAAISESLEHKLQRGPQQVFSPRAPPAGPLNQQAEVDPRGAQQRAASSQQHEIAFGELDRNSIINRLWTRLMRADRAPGASTGRPLKARPTISMPVSMGQSAARRGSMAGASGTSASDNTKTSSSHLVSSKANLIQDSTTASDGTASSGRSSSSSGQQNQQNELAPTIMAPLGGYPSSASYMQPAVWMQPPDALQTSRSPNGGTAAPDCGLYVNHAMTGSNNYNQALEQAHLYTNSVAYLAQPSANPYMVGQHQQQKPEHSAQMIDGYTAQPLGWSEHHNQSATPIGLGHHYPMSNLVQPGESQFNGLGRAYYASIANKQLAAGQQRHNFQNQTSSNYGTLPVRMPPNQMVATSDAGDAYFDANYGTLISRSSVYKTLGYAASSTSSNNQHNNCHSESSSPNSLTTHTNNTLNGSNQDNAHLPALKLSSQTLLNGDIQFGDNQVAVIHHSDGSTITTNTSLANEPKSSSNDKGLATNV